MHLTVQFLIFLTNSILVEILPLSNILKNESKIASYTNGANVREESLKSAGCTQLD